MIGWFFRILLIVLVALVAAVATLPLGVVTGQVEARGASGFSWTQVQGTIWNGRISNLRFGRQVIGDARLSLKPEALLGGTLAYHVELEGAAVRGGLDAGVNLSRQVSLNDINLTADARHLVGMNDAVRAAGGIARISGAGVDLGQMQCRSARGTVSTDMLVALGTRYDQALPELGGEIRCIEGMLVVALEGAADSGVSVWIDSQIGLVAPSRLEARVEGAEGDVAVALDALGFTSRSGEYTYVREQVLTGGFQ